MLKENKINKLGKEGFSNFLKERITDDDLLEESYYQIAFQCLKHIDFNDLNRSESSVKEHCEKVLRLILPPFAKSLFENPIPSFLLQFLEIKTLPYSHLQSLKTEAYLDLEKVKKLLEYYEQDSIKTKIENDRTHDGFVIKTFYCRTLEKQDKIQKYLIDDVKKIAIRNAKSSLEVQEIVRSGCDYPYRDPIFTTNNNWIGFGIDIEKLDHRKINKLRNKTIGFEFQSDISSLYDYNEDINIGLSNIDHTINLETICKLVKDFPIIDARIDIFEELKFLYKEEKWYGFYALALLQIEGIFAEMKRIIIKSDENSTKTLRDKAENIRPYYENSDHFLDYYEFHLPKIRNTFSHLGKINDENNDKIKWRIECIYLILDIKFILDEIANNLKSPIIEIKNIIDAGKEYFSDIDRYSKFIKLIEKCKSNQNINFALIESKTKKFVKNDIFKDIDFSFFITNLQLDFNKAAKDFEQYFAYLSMQEIKFFSRSNKDICDKREEIKNLVNEIPFGLNLNLKLLVDTEIFISYFKKADINEQVKSQILSFYNENKEKLSKISTFKQVVKPELPDGYFHLQNKWLHSRVKNL